MKRVYLDYNATAPLRPEARAAMIAAMDVVGNPSSVHAEGRAAKMRIERARAQVAELVGCRPAQIVFTGGATEAAAIALHAEHVLCAPLEHDSVKGHCSAVLPCDGGGVVQSDHSRLIAVQSANSETGVLQTAHTQRYLVDLVQSIGKLPVDFANLHSQFGLVSAHKFGGPKGVGALVVANGVDPVPLFLGGGQEMSRRAGTENIIGIAGFGAAAAAAKRDLDNGEWDRVEKLRNILEKGVAKISSRTIFVGKEVARLPNTSCMLTPGWKGETQVMQMDLAGFAISAGSACSSGKVKSSRVLRAMGYTEDEASCAIRVSLGLETTTEEIMRFIDVWGETYRKHKARAV
jgi:cysteine desulfurase